VSEGFTGGGGRAYDGQADEGRGYEGHADDAHADEAHTDTRPALSQVVLPLLKGVLYREDDLTTWGALIDLQAQVRDYVAVLQLDLVIDEAEGYAFLRSRRDDDVLARARQGARLGLVGPQPLDAEHGQPGGQCGRQRGIEFLGSRLTCRDRLAVHQAGVGAPLRVRRCVDEVEQVPGVRGFASCSPASRSVRGWRAVTSVTARDPAAARERRCRWNCST
jgi:hypothetical protein